MAKKKSSNNQAKLLFNVLTILILGGAIAFMFMAFLNGKGKLLGSTWSYTGFEVAFGVKDGDTQILNASVGGILIVSLLGLALIVSLLKLFANKNIKPLLSFLVLLLAVTAGVFAFLSTTTFVFNVDPDALDIVKVGYNISLGIGAILTASFAICAGVLSGLELLVK